MTEKHNSISIFISSHKPAEHIEGKYFIPIQVGAALPGKKKIDGFIQYLTSVLYLYLNINPYAV